MRAVLPFSMLGLELMAIAFILLPSFCRGIVCCACGMLILTIYFSSVAYSKDGYGVPFVIDGVQNSIIADSKAVFFATTELLGSSRSGIVFQHKNSLADACMNQCGELLHLPISRGNKVDFVAHS